jgi:tetratricopeptide (TPR) repeat protein
MTRYRYSPLGAVIMLLLVMCSPVLADDYDDAVRLHKQGKTAAALKKVDAAIAANANDARSRFLKGLILTEQGNTKGAIDVFTSLTSDYPELPEPYNNLAVLYAGEGQYDKARESLEMAIRTHPSYAVAHENLGDVYAKMASEAYDKALSLDRGNKTAQTKLSLIGELFTAAAPLENVPAAAAPSEPPAAAAPVSGKPTPEKPAPEKPAPAVAAAPPANPATPPAQPQMSQRPAVIAAVGNWAKAWSDQDVDAYLSHYAADFMTGRQSRSEWEQQRRARLTRPKFIMVAIDEPVVSFSGEDSANVRFLQHYQSDTIDSKGYKTLTLGKSDGRWLIVKEVFEN